MLALVGALHGLVYVPLVQSNVGTDSSTYIATASALEHGSYTTPLRAGFYFTYPIGFFDLTGLRFPRSPVWNAPERQAFRTPGYPLLLAAVGGGEPGLSRAAALLAQALLFGAGVYLLALVVRRWWNEGVALLAAGLYALDPYSKHYVALVLTEVLTGTVVLACTYACTRAWQERSLAWWSGTGALAAALTLVRPVFVLAVPLVALAAALRSRRALGGVAALLCAALLLVPWLGWTRHVTGRAVLADWGEGFNLLLAAEGEGHGRAASEVQESPAFAAALRSLHRSAPSNAALLRDPRAHGRYLARSDARLRELAWSRYGERLRHEPARVAWETLYRMSFLWAAHQDWFQPSGAALAVLQAIDWITLALALGGIALALVRRGPAAAVALFLVAYTLVLGIHHVEARFAMPLRGLYLAFAALALAELGQTAISTSRLRAGSRTARRPR